MRVLFANFWTDERGATSIEYAVIAAIMTGALVGSLQMISSAMETKYESVSSSFEE